MAMWKFLLLHQFLWITTLQSELSDLLLTADEFFKEFHSLNNSNVDAEALKQMIKRSYNLDEERKISKRSVEGENLIKDSHGVYFLSNIQDVSRIPVKFPNDINIISYHNLLYIAALEANGSNPEIQLANDLVLFYYSSIQGIKEIGRVPVLGGTKVAFHLFQNITYIIAAEHEAKENPELYQGSTVYKMTEKGGRVFLEKIQILNVIQPNDLKFWEHQDQLYLVIGTNMGNSSDRTGTLVYRWLGHHFDLLQVIPSKNVKSVMPFTIGSFMFLAVANFQDEYSNVDINSEIFQFELQGMKFKSFQKLTTHGAQDISYFNFEDIESKEKEHFLIVANSLGKNPDGSLTSLKESVVYKFSENYFIPFQSFRLSGTTQWLPVKGPRGEFLLLGSYTNGVVGYQYDGWRFVPISLKFGQSFFGRNIQSMRAFYYFGDTFLAIADKSSYGNNVNLWKLWFTNKNDLETHYRELESWCSEMETNMTQDDFNRVLSKFDLHDEIQEHSESNLEIENLMAEDLSQEIRDELENLNKKFDNLEKTLKEAEDHMENYKAESELPIILGSQEIAFLELKCKTKDCSVFKKAKILTVNGENFTDFLLNAVPLNKNLESSVLDFEHVVLENDLSSPMINGRPSDTLIDVSFDTFINAPLIVNGTVFINQNLIVSGLFDRVRPDAEHMLLAGKFQNIQEEVIVNNLRVKNLKISKFLNGEPVESLSRKPEIKLPNDLKELRVNNMFVEGLIGGYNLSEILKEALRKSGNQILQGDISISTLEADEVQVDSNDISNISTAKILEAIQDRLCQPNPISFVSGNALGPEDLSFKSFASESDSDEAEKSENADEYIVIVEGLLKVKELSDENNSTLLLDVLNNSLKLNESVVDSKFHFSNIQAEDFEMDFLNEIPLSSWILKESDEVQNVRGRKLFLKGVRIQEEVIVERINKIDLEKLEEDVLKLEDDQIIPADLNFNIVKCFEVNANSTNFGNNTFDKMNRLEIKDSVIADQVQVENLTLTGEIDSISWENILEDSVYENDVVSGKKTINGAVRVQSLNITGRVNDLLFEEFVALTSGDANKILLDRNVTLNKPLNVDELHFEGFLDNVLKPKFEREWLLKDTAQIITGPMTFENVNMKSGSNLMNETVNNINLRKLFTNSIKINEDTKIKHLFSLGKVIAERIDIGNNFNGANFKESILRCKSETAQVIAGNWFLSQGLTIDGSLIVEGFVSGLNLSQMCDSNFPEKVNLIVGGSVVLKQEPIVLSKVNNVNLTEKAKEIWMKNKNATLRGQNLTFSKVEFDNKVTLSGFLNNVNLTDLSKLYLSKTLERVISADYDFDTLVIKKWGRMHEARVGGLVNGVNLNHWARNVLLQDEEQIIGEKLRFEKFETSNLNLKGTLNGFDLSKDVLRLDVENAVVEGEKTFQAINVLNLTITEGRNLQGVNMDSWRENSVKTAGDAVIKGDLVLEDAMFNGPFKVLGKVNELQFDSQHLLTTTGNQLVRGRKRFDYTDRMDSGIKIRFFKVSGDVSGINLDSLIKHQAYSDKNLVFERPKTFTKGLVMDSMEVDGTFHGVDVSGMCAEVFNPVDVNSQKEEILSLLNQTKALIRVVKDRAFFFDYFELIQTLKPNIKAIVPTVDSKGNYLLAVFSSTTMKFMDWNDYSESFAYTDEGLNLTDNITFVTSEVSQNGSFLYIETTKSAKIFEPKLLKEIEAINTSCIASFKLEVLNKSCIFVGQKWNSSRILCNSFLMNDLQTYQWLDSKGSVQVAVLTIEDETFIAAINKEVVFDKIENTLSIYRFDKKLQHFYVSHTLAEINPVALSSVTYKNNYYLVSAGGHLPESVHNSVLSIFKFDKRHKVFVRAQSIQVDTPVDVHFSILPSSQLALYVLTSNPTKPFVVFLHKGISGFVEETSGLSLYPGSQLYSFTDMKAQHFVIISGFGRGQILKAGFKGEKADV